MGRYLLAGHYQARQVELACHRYRLVTNETYVDFLKWLGFSHNIEYPNVWQMGRDLVCHENAPCRRKMDLLLSPHWHALLKAHLIAEEAQDEIPT